MKREQSQPPSIADLDPAAYNVEAMARVEHEALHQRTTAERVSGAITRFTGSMMFLVFQVMLFVFWVVVNLGLTPGVELFDPFPFGVLTLIVSAEGVFLAIFILISQNRMTRQADRRAHLDLQISMLAEQELTMILRLQQRLCRRLGVEVENEKEEVTQLMQRTDVQRIMDDIDEKLPTDG